MQHLGISPDGAVLVVGGGLDFGGPGLVRGFDPGDGAELWQVELPDEGGL
jgi:hypothetical protein